MRRIEELINVPQYIRRFLDGWKEGAGNELTLNCPFHRDKHASFSINSETGCWKCYVPSCEAFNGGNLVQLVSLLKHMSTKDAYHFILEANGIKQEKEPVAPKELCEEKVIEYHMTLLGETPVLEVLHKKYLYTIETINRFKLGWNGSRITIPIYDEEGKLVNIRKKPLDSGHCTGVEFFNQMRLFPIQALQEETIYLFEGEKDCMLACQLGLNGLTVTSGAGSFAQDWLPYFKDKKIIICYDIDAAGLSGAHRVKEFILNATAELRIIGLPITTPANGDFTDYILQGGTKESFLKIIENTAIEPKLIHQETRIPTYVHDTDLGRASDAEFYYKRVRFNVVVSGKDTQPYMPPAEIEITCPANQSFCKYCGMMMYGGKFTFKLNELSQDLLQWIDCPEEHHTMLIKRNMEIPMKCKLWKTFISKAQTVEEITLIPEISYAARDTDYVIRTAYVIGKSVRSNCSYRLEAITLPHPRDQYATHLVYKISENKTNIDEFEMTEEMKEELGVFKV